MYMRRSSLFWGAILIVIGFVLVLSNLGLLGNINIWELVWPAFLILLGLWFLLGTVYRKPVESEHIEIPLSEFQKGYVNVKHGAGRLRIYPGSSSYNLVEGDFGGGLEYDTQSTGDTLKVRLRMPSQFFPVFWAPGFSIDWSIRLAQDIPMSLIVDSGANDAQIDLKELNVQEFKLKSGVSSAKVYLPANAGYTKVQIDSGVSSVDLNIPEGVAAKIRSHGGLSSLNINKNRFPKTGNYYQSPEYVEAENKVDIELQMGVGSVSVK